MTEGWLVVAQGWMEKGTGGGGGEGITANGSVGGNENVLKLDSADNHTNL